MNILTSKPENKSMSLILASGSPRRRELLTQLGFKFSQCGSDIDESVKPEEAPSTYVLRLAEQKALHVFNNLTDEQKRQTFVLGSDTSVICDDKILGKPESEAHCIDMLSLLSNRQHHVLTAIALVGKDKVQRELVTTMVTFKALSTDEIKAYWRTGEPQDKAGAYGIQGIAGQFVMGIKGSYSAVVGLPLYETANLLTNVGFIGAIDILTNSSK